MCVLCVLLAGATQVQAGVKTIAFAGDNDTPAAGGEDLNAPLMDNTTVVGSFSVLGGKPYKVSYNKRSMLVDGKPVLLMSGSVHYVRSTPEMWPSIFAKMKASGMNAVESYVFWNYHVETLQDRATPDYTGRGNVTLFLELAAAADLFVIWRIGPYICAEWPGGGMPSWLKQVGPGMHPRSATQPYQDTCYDWMHQHIEYVRPFFAQSGGPIIMLQIENELSGSSDTPYVQWLGELATELKTGLPWIMCHGAHANDTIETCNGCNCEGDVPGLQAQDQPAMWSEDEQWFDRFTQGASVRATGNVGYGVANFVATGGSMHNFYMFHGGTMWGNWSTTIRRTRLTPSYANTANLASDSIIYDPKYSSIATLHKIIAEHASTILHTPLPISVTTMTGSGGDTIRVVALSGSSGDPPLTFYFNDDKNKTATLPPPKGGSSSLPMGPSSARILDGSGKMLWYSEPGVEDGVGQPYLPALKTALKWSSWNNSGPDHHDQQATPLLPPVEDTAAVAAAASDDDEDTAAAPAALVAGATSAAAAGTWYGTKFARPALPSGAQLSVNLTGFGQGNLFLNGVHVVYFNLEDGECFKPPGGVNGHGSCLGYVKERCDKPTQDCYHVPPEWLADENEMLVWSDARLPTNITGIDPYLTSVVYRVDPPAVWAQVEALVETHEKRRRQI